jgi:hypothetical protein
MPGTGSNAGFFYKGYIITMRVDPRDCLGHGDARAFNFIARLKNSNTITITAPALDHFELGGDDRDIQALLNTNEPDDIVVAEALENAREEWTKSERENKMYYELIFNNDVDLCCECLAKHVGKTKGLLTLEALPVVVNVDALVDAAGNAVSCFNGVIMWRIADLNQGNRKARLNNAVDHCDATAARLNRLNIGG